MLAEPALAANGVRAIATTLPGFGRVPFPPGFDAGVEAYAAFAGNLARDLGCHVVHDLAWTVLPPVLWAGARVAQQLGGTDLP